MLIEIIEDGQDLYGSPRYRIRRTRTFLFFKYYEYGYYTTITLGGYIDPKHVKWVTKYNKKCDSFYTTNLKFLEDLFEAIINYSSVKSEIKVIKSNQAQLNEKSMKNKLGIK